MPGPTNDAVGHDLTGLRTAGIGRNLIPLLVIGLFVLPFFWRPLGLGGTYAAAVGVFALAVVVTLVR